MNFGIPYMGSKSGICKYICQLFPKADNFYDLFGGGFSITHFMLKYRSKDFKQFHFNELRQGICELIKDAIAGKYNYDVFKPEWISREEFFKRKDSDMYVNIVWSFGNSGRAYLFGKDSEEQKRSMHMAIVFNEFDDFSKKVFGMEKFKDGFSVTDKRLFLKDRIRIKGKDERLQQLEQLQQLQQLERLQQLQQLERLERLEFYNKSYSEVPIKENSIIYCDPPYAGTAKYADEFDTKKFLDWADQINQPVFISEYEIRDDRFKRIYSVKKRSILAANQDNTLYKQENVYINRAGYEKLYKKEIKPLARCL